MRVYIAGPMTGIEQYNYPAFRSAAALLRMKGFDVITPVELGDRLDGGMPGKRTYQEYLIACIHGLLQCDTIYLLDGWHMSKGARLEFHIAKALDYQLLDHGFELNSMSTVNDLFPVTI